MTGINLWLMLKLLNNRGCLRTAGKPLAEGDIRGIHTVIPGVNRWCFLIAGNPIGDPPDQNDNQNSAQYIWKPVCFFLFVISNCRIFGWPNYNGSLPALG